MSGLKIDVTVDVKDVLAGLEKLGAQGRDLSRVFVTMRKPVRKDQREHAKAAKGPDGAWPKRAQSTKDRRGNRRRLLGTMPTRTIVIKADRGGISAESKVPWSGVHQHGGAAGNGAKIPARTFLWFSPEFLTEAAGQIEKALAEAF